MPLIGPEDPAPVFLKKAADAGITGGTIMSLPPLSFRPDPERSQHWRDRLGHILEYTKDTPGFHPFFWIDPTENDAEKQIFSATEAGIHGFKCICNHFMPKTQLKKFSAIAETGRPIQFHSGILFDHHDSGEYTRPLAYECLLNVKNLKFSLAHLGWPWCDEFIAVFGKLQAAQNNVLHDQNVRMYIDLTPGTPYQQRREVLRRLYLMPYRLEKRVLWGSDCRINNYDTNTAISWLELDREIMAEIVRESRSDKHFVPVDENIFELATNCNFEDFYATN